MKELSPLFSVVERLHELLSVQRNTLCLLKPRRKNLAAFHEQDRFLIINAYFVIYISILTVTVVGTVAKIFAKRFPDRQSHIVSPLFGQLDFPDATDD